MKTIAEIHVENLDELAKPFGSQRQFAIHLNKDPKQVNQWWGKGSARGIGPQLARELEAHFGKPRGWLDNDHSQLQRLDAEIIRSAITLAKKSFHLVHGEELVIERDPEAFSQALRTAIAMRQRRESENVGSGSGDGQAGAAGGAAGEQEDGQKAEPARSRKRKSA